MKLSTLDTKQCDRLEEVALHQDVGSKTLLRIPGRRKMLQEDVRSPACLCTPSPTNRHLGAPAPHLDCIGLWVCLFVTLATKENHLS